MNPHHDPALMYDAADDRQLQEQDIRMREVELLDILTDAYRKGVSATDCNSLANELGVKWRW